MALRRDRKTDGDWTILPAEGRPGRAPAWPMVKATARERALWNGLWKLPQATEWERNHLEMTVALYVRRLAEAELPGSKVTLSTLIRQLGDGLGLTAPGMASLRWRVAPIETPAPTPTGRGRQTTAVPNPARARLQVVADAVEQGERTA
jgi:hypothetical protein